MRPAADTESPFARYGLAGGAGTDAFWEAARTPAFLSASDTDGGWMTLFLWRGSAATVDFESWSPPVPLRRWGATDCWYAEVRTPQRLRFTYQFVVDGVARSDPFNPAGAGGDRSVAATPDAPAQPHWPLVGADDVLPVPGTRLRWTSTRLGGRRTVRIHPAGGGGPVVLLLDGDDWLYLHPAVTAFDSAVASGEMEPVTLVFLPAKDREGEFGCEPGLWEAVRDELLPLVAEADVVADLDRLVVAGQSLGGLSAMYAALEHPDLVTRIACQSPSFWWTPEAPSRADPLGGPVGGTIAARLRERPDLSGLRAAFTVGEHEKRMLPHCEITEALAEQAGATVRVSRTASDHDRAGWRGALLTDVAWALG
ncbi:alpha/beta hydrolase-fold protein [Streptomyces tsukubensis]|uniref:Enterochelin esterase n=1 Tax=Streptomyces tsukubensis TaxID=83656 RepID=A0A1V4AD92_9ACTN|nr:alpha/beta hydrolase-fold protein [Streptomyces tsukubensis]OON81922.1 enterochelin esterase [Streptomyces tsukubensis]QFR96448.1 enterochelin esterase [Streptomyces tsukubensis]